MKVLFSAQSSGRLAFYGNRTEILAAPTRAGDVPELLEVVLSSRTLHAARIERKGSVGLWSV